MHSLPETGYHIGERNPVEELFYGRIPVEHAMALLFFNKGSRYRRLIYQLKYQERKENGIFLGKLIGSRLQDSHFGTIDCIIPVPLHRTKLRRRGYNQSAIISQGISQVLNVPVIENALYRRSFTATQTRKGRYERWKNVEGIFECRNPDLIKNKRILLVDDVVTTGATLEAAGSCLLEIEGVRLLLSAAAYSTT
jgi:ComF family protein